MDEGVGHIGVERGSFAAVRAMKSMARSVISTFRSANQTLMEHRVPPSRPGHELHTWIASKLLMSEVECQLLRRPGEQSSHFCCRQKHIEIRAK